MTNKKVLIIDDDIDMCTLLTRFLERKGFKADMATSGSKGIAAFKENRPDVVLCDFRLGDKDGVDVLKELKEIDAEVPVIIVTGYSDIKMAVQVMRLGAKDYLTKPLIPEEVLALINKSIEEKDQGIGVVTAPAPRRQQGAGTADYLIGKSAATQELYRQVNIVAPTPYSVIIYGESGTGKEVIAQTIHQLSQRKQYPFVAVDCGTLSRELAASELFGHMKGSFTGAQTDKEGLIEVANGGTLFLDEIANLSPDVQTTLLRVIQERKMKRVGGTKDIHFDVRVIVASNENLPEACRLGKFREDLYHRFNEFSINIPPLRDRKEDIPLFAEYFLNLAGKELNKTFEGFDDEVMQLFTSYAWPGNLREFRNVVRRAGLLNSSGKISANSLPWEILGSGSGTGMPPGVHYTPDSVVAPPQPEKPVITDLRDAAVQAEFNTIMEVLKQVRYNKTKAAAILKIDRKTLYNKIRYYEENNMMS